MKKIFLLSAMSILIASCTGNTQQKSNQNQQTTAPVAHQNSVTLNANDQMQFDKKTITVKANKKVKLTLNHTGKLDKAVMGHNFVLLKKGTDIATFAQKAMEAADNQYIPLNSEDVIAYTDLIGGGASTTIEFDAPQVGTYEFICSFPGHYALMKGTFVVEK